jgi:hypothetical protein
MQMAKDKPKRSQTDEPDLRDIVQLHTLASKKLGLLRDEHQALVDTGKKVAAKAALQRAEKLATVVRALEAKVKQYPAS